MNEKERKQLYYQENKNTLDSKHEKWNKEHPEELKEIQKKARHRYYLTHKEQLRINQTKWRHKLKQEVINVKGGKCEICGYSGHIAPFEFHHINPDEKENKGSNGTTGFKKFRDNPEELAKVQLLCSNCHAIIHFKE